MTAIAFVPKEQVLNAASHAKKVGQKAKPSAKVVGLMETIRAAKPVKAKKKAVQADSAPAAILQPETPEPAHAPKPEPRKAKAPNIASITRDAILAGDDNATALAKVKAAFPDGNTNLGCISWYRNDLRKKGLMPKT